MVLLQGIHSGYCRVNTACILFSSVIVHSISLPSPSGIIAVYFYIGILQMVPQKSLLIEKFTSFIVLMSYLSNELSYYDYYDLYLIRNIYQKLLCNSMHRQEEAFLGFYFSCGNIEKASGSVLIVKNEIYKNTTKINSKIQRKDFSYLKMPCLQICNFIFALL